MLPVITRSWVPRQAAPLAITWQTSNPRIRRRQPPSQLRHPRAFAPDGARCADAAATARSSLQGTVSGSFVVAALDRAHDGFGVGRLSSSSSSLFSAGCLPSADAANSSRAFVTLRSVSMLICRSRCARCPAMSAISSRLSWAEAGRGSLGVAFGGDCAVMPKGNVPRSCRPITSGFDIPVGAASSHIRAARWRTSDSHAQRLSKTHARCIFGI